MAKRDAHHAEDGTHLKLEKVWTSSAQLADWGALLARTDPEAKKHKGIGYFLVDMSTPGSDFIRTFFVRDNTTEPTGGFNIDEVRVGTTWQDVAIPEPGSALLAASLAPLLLRRRRRERGHMRPPDIARRLA